MHLLFRVVAILLVAHAATVPGAVMAHSFSTDAPAAKTEAQETSVIVVNGRPLVGPNSAAQVRGGRLFLPVATIAEALGDTFNSDSSMRIATVRRQNGTTAVFNGPLNEVRENGSVILTVSGTSDLVFPPISGELMLPAEIVSALLDVTVRRDERNAIIVSRKDQQVETVHTGEKHSRFELFQLEYDYNFSRYSSVGDHNLILRGTGRAGDARLSFISNSSMAIGHDSFGPKMIGGSVRLDRPNGQSFVGGEFGTGTDVPFLSAAVRGGLVQLPVRTLRLDFFGGQTTSGIVQAQANESPADPNQHLLRVSDLNVRYDTAIFGAIATTATETPSQTGITLSGGALHFAGPNRRGDVAAGDVKYATSLNRFQADVAVGNFSGVGRYGNQISGSAFAVNLIGSSHLTDQLLVQAQYSYVGENFLGSQSGLHEPVNSSAVSVNWQPRKWMAASISGSTATTPGKVDQFNRYVTATLNLTPENHLPSFFVTHTQTSTTQLRDASFTLMNATKRFRRWQLFFNGSRVKTFGDASLTAQIGSNIRINESNSLEVSQSQGSRGVFTGMVTWQTSNLLGHRLSLSGGLGYTRSSSAPLQVSEHLSASLKLRRNTTVQFSYLKTETGTTALLSLHGFFFSSKGAERALNGPLAELNRYGAVHGRVYQDLNLNGRFDPGIDQPQANVRVRVDGSRYVVSDETGNFRVDSVIQGEHSVYLDLLSVRADLTFLDNARQVINLNSGRDVIVDLRVVRTGRITGIVWLDVNENGRLDEGEQPLPDVRVVTGSGRDTLTDEKGYFIIGDLPPGEHILLLDERTIPTQTRSSAGSQTIKVAAGDETVTAFPVTSIPDQVKRFPN
jgi:hypothetical protein